MAEDQSRYAGGAIGLFPTFFMAGFECSTFRWKDGERKDYVSITGHDRHLEADYAALTDQVASALTAVASATEPAARLAIVEKARKTLADWPRTHYNYREAEIRPMLGMLDEIVGELRAIAGGGRFDLALVARTDAPVKREPLALEAPRKARGLLRLGVVDDVDAQARAVLERLDDRPRDVRVRRDVEDDPIRGAAAAVAAGERESRRERCKRDNCRHGAREKDSTSHGNLLMHSFFSLQLIRGLF